MRYLLSSVLLFAVFSCSPKILKGLEEQPSEISQITNPYFADTAQDYVYKAKIDVYGKYFGGILIIKKVNDTSHRVVFTTEFGSKLFDFLYEGNTFTKKFIVPDLDRNIIVNTLQKDFKILITEKVDVQSEYISEIPEILYKTEFGNRYNYYGFSDEKKLVVILNASKSKEKIIFTFQRTNNEVIKKLRIQHLNIKLNIDLEYLNK
ncbi:hypothetical protein ULMS_07480 [Patiriisocius marinistellae]|uniref:Lipoprotein n=1 Tax=Patiriisocius marinistellae TaxID=2494560 RepID=A0A5J4FTY6_9FLAO|nr:hypothetical protein [Patiriisocius marinistellae]GEQ85240.1 hypothetical protein ULMS_07480 [Patiriisocius marinistellae]